MRDFEFWFHANWSYEEPMIPALDLLDRLGTEPLLAFGICHFLLIVKR